MDQTTLALQKIARGAGIILAGTVISMFFGILSRAIIARYFSVGEYGVFNLALTVLNIVLVMATLGFQNSLPREIAFYKEKDPSRINTLISTALMIVFISSAIWVVILILEAGNMAQVFDDERLAYTLKMIAFALPFQALIVTVLSISRGFERVRETVYFQNIVYPIVFLVFIVLGVFLNFPFTYVFFAYALAQAFTLLALVFDLWQTRLFGLGISLDLKLGRGLIWLSLPLMLNGILWFVMNWTDTLMLGYYRTSEAVGLYNAASPLARLLPIFLTSTEFLYLPIASRLYAQNKIDEMKRTYQVLTKWVFLLTLPIFGVMFLFPEATIGFFFGEKYVSAALSLEILALGFMFHAFLGSNGISLLVAGEVNFIMVSNLFSAVLNVILNAFLIPIYGMNGAAVATATSYFAGNILKSLKLYKKTKIHPFSWNYVKLLVISFLLLVLIRSLNLEVPSIWHTIPVLVAFLSVYFLLVLISRSIDKEDVELLLTIEKRVGVDLGVVKKILKKFV